MIRFELPRSGEVQLRVFDVTGRRVDDLVAGRMEAGVHSLTWHPAKSLPSGAYFLRLNFDESRFVMRKVLLVK